MSGHLAQERADVAGVGLRRGVVECASRGSGPSPATARVRAGRSSLKQLALTAKLWPAPWRMA